VFRNDFNHSPQKTNQVPILMFFIQVLLADFIKPSNQ
jgi:hypothetical protein